VEDEGIDGTRVGIVEGGRYSVQLLFEALMLASGNDAANALARAAGGQERTVEAMNETAYDLGAFDTVAGTPSGLDVAGQSTSVYDLALIFRALLEEPGAAAVLTTPAVQMPVVPGRFHSYQIQNKNPLLGRHPGNLGAKNGFTSAARHGFVTAAERGGRRLVASVLGSEAVPLRAAEQAARLLDWGFSVPAGTDGVGRLIRPAEARAYTGQPAIPRHDDLLAPPSGVGTTEGLPTDAPAPPVVPVVLAALAVVIVGATLVGRRRAARPAPARAPARTPPPAPEGPAPGSSPASPSTPP
jgi:D-alanyl-D-alanine carboxypeptidase (penicillin-binding protein 5/6)